VPVDKAVLEQCIVEQADGDAEYADFLRKRYAGNDALAVKFVAGYMRTADYTQKSQALAADRKKWESDSAGLTQQLETARQALDSVNTEKDKILKELAGHRITTAKARELMRMLQEKYEVSEADLPGMTDLIETAKTGRPVDSTPDVETRLTAMIGDLEKRLKGQFVDTLKTELGAMTDLDIIWPELAYEHEQLMGKPITAQERREILDGARKGEGSIRGVWEKKFNIDGDNGLRMQKRDERIIAENRTKWEAEQADKISKKALEVVTPMPGEVAGGAGVSLAFRDREGKAQNLQGRDFYHPPGNSQFQGEAGKDGATTLSVMPGQHARVNASRGPTGAQRAAQKFLERGMSKSA
jgi:hypothetical protein